MLAVMNLLPPSTFNPFLTVAASAGTGKTYLLVNRLVRLLLEEQRPASLLAITFTRKAAAEMHQRLLARLRDLASMSEAELQTPLRELELTPTADLIRRARGLYEVLLFGHSSVKTTTFHAFCQDLLRRFPLEADVPPGFELTERTGSLQDEAWEAFTLELTDQANTPQALAMDKLLRELSLFSTQHYLNTFLQHRSDWWAYTHQQADPVGFATGQLRAQLPANADTDPLPAWFANALAMQRLRNFANLLRQHKTQTNLEHAELLESGLTAAKQDELAFEKIWGCFYTGDGDPRKRKESGALSKALGTNAAQQFVELHTTVCDELADLRRQQHAHLTLRLSQYWFQCGARYLWHYQRIKRELRLLDFADLEWKTYQLLCHSDNAHWVQYKLDERLQHILVDEFQDTNPTQWQLLLPLLQEIAAGNPDTNQHSVLLVGDAKQSIYRFRRAEPQLFHIASAWLQQHLHAKQLTLSKSWRSSPAILHVVNQLFAAESPLQLPDFIPHVTALTELWGRVSVLPLAFGSDADDADAETTSTPSTAPRDLLRTPRYPATATRYYQEGQRLAALIQELITARLPIQRNGDTHPLRHADIMVLFRQRDHLGDYERALREAGIPFLGNERGTLLASLEVKDMVNLLQWLVTPFDNLALAGILRSPLFTASDADLLTLAGKKAWYERLIPHALDCSDSPLPRAARLLPRWLQLTQALPVHDLLDKIYSEGNVLARYTSAYPAHLQPRVNNNLARFLELALESDSGRYPSLTRFLDWLGSLEQSSDAPDQPSSAGNSDRVQLLTIHSAKGLEAPLIILADSARGHDNKRTSPVLIDWPAQHPAPSSFLLHPSGKFPNAYNATQLARREELATQEETNLLYVALTRARQYLYISGNAAPKPDTPNEKLGWYGAICSVYQQHATELTQAVILHEMAAPAITTAATTPMPLRATLQVDPRLQEPCRLPPHWHEIAPSHDLHAIAPYGGSGDADGELRGQIIHAMLQYLAQTPQADFTPWRSRMIQAASEELLQACWDEATRTFTHPAFQFLYDHSQCVHAYNEVPLYYRRDNALVHGVIDRLVVQPDRIYVVDYKSHRYADTANMLQIGERYRAQLAYYVDGIARLWPDKPITAMLLFTQGPDRLDLNLATATAI
jgi:ATP-dependent helicase/nuclease subunit A